MQIRAERNTSSLFDHFEDAIKEAERQAYGPLNNIRMRVKNTFTLPDLFHLIGCVSAYLNEYHYQYSYQIVCINLENGRKESPRKMIVFRREATEG